MDPVSLASPSQVLAHTGAVQVFYLPLQSRQGLGRKREGTRACLSLHLLL